MAKKTFVLTMIFKAEGPESMVDRICRDPYGNHAIGQLNVWDLDGMDPQVRSKVLALTAFTIPEGKPIYDLKGGWGGK